MLVMGRQLQLEVQKNLNLFLCKIIFYFNSNSVFECFYGNV